MILFAVLVYCVRDGCIFCCKTTQTDFLNEKCGGCTVAFALWTEWTYLFCLDSLTLTTGQYANATLTITPPANTASGTDVTLTLDAKSADGLDSNYAVLGLSVLTKVMPKVK